MRIYTNSKREHCFLLANENSDIPNLKHRMGDLPSHEGRETAIQYEFGYPLCVPSILGGNKYSHIFLQCNLKRISLQMGVIVLPFPLNELSGRRKLTKADSYFSILTNGTLDMPSLFQAASESFRQEEMTSQMSHLRNWVSEMLVMIKDNPEMCPLIKSGSGT